MTDIIYFSLFRWNNPYSSVSISMCKEFAKHGRVFYINHPISYKDLLGGWSNDVEVQAAKWDLLKGSTIIEEMKGLENVISVTTPLSLPINWMSEGKMYQSLRKRNEAKIRNTIQQVIEKYNIKEYIFMNCFDPFFQDILPVEHPPKINIYQCIDDISQNDYTSKHGVRLEIESVKKADMTLVTSRELRNLMSQYSDNVHIVHNAADISLFKEAVSKTYQRPAEIANVNTKIIGFTGNLDAVRINYPLLKQIAETHTDKTLLLVGPINSPEVAELGLDKMPNVILTGSKKITELPSYLHFCDCVIIPFLCNKLTKSIYPLKINEYLAAGRSVVSSDFSEDIRTFGEQIQIAQTDTEFVRLIDKAIHENTESDIAARQAVAATNTWTARVQQFWEIVSNFEQKKQKTKQVV